MMGTVAVLALLAAFLLLLLAAGAASIFSVELAIAFLAWAIATFMAAITDFDPQKRSTLLAFAFASSVASALLGTFGQGTAELMLPSAGLFGLAGFAWLLGSRRPNA